MLNVEDIKSIIKALEFKQILPWLKEAEGLGGSYKIHLQDGKCYAIKNIYHAGDREPIPFATFDGAEKWCQEDHQKEVLKFLKTP